MPEETQKPTSGTAPGERKPTVIGGGQKPSEPQPEAPKERKATVIGGGSPPSQTGNQQPEAPKERKATVIGGNQPATAPQAPKPAVQPTSIAPKVASVIPPNPQPAQPSKPIPVKQASAIRGDVRKGVEVTKDDLLRYAPSTPLEVIEEAQRILRGVVVKLLTDAQGVQWGDDRQKKYGELTEKSLLLVGSKLSQDSGRHLTRLLAILNEINEVLSSKPSKGFFRKSADPRQEFDERKPELDQLRGLLEKALPELTQAEADLLTLADEFNKLATAIDAESLAARYLADVLVEKDKTRLIQALEDRSGSLTKTAANIRHGMVVRAQAENNLRTLKLQITEGVRNALPGWIESVIIVFQQPSPTDTDLYGLRTGLDDILQRLKK